MFVIFTGILLVEIMLMVYFYVLQHMLFFGLYGILNGVLAAGILDCTSLCDLLMLVLLVK